MPILSQEYFKKCSFLDREQLPPLQKYLTNCLNIIRNHNNSIFYLNTSSKHRKIDDILIAMEGYFKSLKFTSDDPNFVIQSDPVSNNFHIPGFVSASNSLNIRFENVIFQTPTGTTRINNLHWDKKPVQNINLNGERVKNIESWLSELVASLTEMFNIYPE